MPLPSVCTSRTNNVLWSIPGAVLNATINAAPFLITNLVMQQLQQVNSNCLNTKGWSVQELNEANCDIALPLLGLAGMAFMTTLFGRIVASATLRSDSLMTYEKIIFDGYRIDTEPYASAFKYYQLCDYSTLLGNTAFTAIGTLVGGAYFASHTSLTENDFGANLLKFGFLASFASFLGCPANKILEFSAVSLYHGCRNYWGAAYDAQNNQSPVSLPVYAIPHDDESSPIVNVQGDDSNLYGSVEIETTV